jgi:sterol desaturase/sphingolipid hydroxylase (fatty acid hydroxylase superfamily)
MFDDLAQWWWLAVDWFSAHAVEPALDFLYLGNLIGEPEDIADALLVALLQILIIACVFRPLETLMPAESWQDRKLTRVDWRSTLLLMLGVSPLFAFLVLSPFAQAFSHAAAWAGLPDEGLLHYFPRIEAHPYLAFGIYYAANDLAYYWMHRAQHAIPWWWALHSMHHSQRQVNCWGNARVSWLDVVIESCLLATVGLLMGVNAGQFAVLVLLAELVQNLAHTNTRLGFGKILDHLIITPRFHRLHHMLVDPARPGLHDCNYGQVLSIWDNLFGTALYDEPPRPNGVGDPGVDADNGRGVIKMQWYTLRRFWGAFTSRTGWRPGEVMFGKDYRPVPAPPPQAKKPDVG